MSRRRARDKVEQEIALRIDARRRPRRWIGRRRPEASSA